MGERTLNEVSFEEAKIAWPCLVLAYVDGEEIGKAILYDIQETDDKSVNLVLEKGTYAIIVLIEKRRALKFDIEI